MRIPLSKVNVNENGPFERPPKLCSFNLNRWPKDRRRTVSTHVTGEGSLRTVDGYTQREGGTRPSTVWSHSCRRMQRDKSLVRRQGRVRFSTSVKGLMFRYPLLSKRYVTSRNQVSGNVPWTIFNQLDWVYMVQGVSNEIILRRIRELVSLVRWELVRHRGEGVKFLSLLLS